MNKTHRLTRRRFLETSLAGLAGLPGRAHPAPTWSEGSKGNGFNDRAKNAGEAERRYDGTVATWFSSHYQVDSRDWDNIREFNGPYHPLLGYYKSDDPPILGQQLHWMRRAGIDLIVYDVFSTLKWTLKDFPKDKTLPLLLGALASQENEKRKLKFCIFLERYLGNPTIEEYEYALNYIKDHLAEKDFYFRYMGRPLVVTYLNGPPTAAIDYIEWKNTYFELHRIRPYVTDVWSYIENYPQMLRKSWMSACPGFDPFLELAYATKYVKREVHPDLQVIRKKAVRADRENGTFYQKQLSWAKLHNPDIIFLSAWNDWQYGNHIEPAVEYQFLYVDLTAKLLGRGNETETYRRNRVPTA